MSFFKKSFQKINDPFKWHEKGVGKVLGKPFGTLASEGILGNADDLKAAGGTRTGSVLSGRAILQGGPKQQNMETARTFDVFGSPATAGTKQQSTARLAAAIYGMIMGGAALGVGGSGGSGVGFGGTTSASTGPTSVAGSSNPFVTNMGYAGNSVGSGVGTASSSPGWDRYARLGSQMMQQGEQGGGTQQGALQHQYVGQPMNRNPYLMGYPWS